MDLKRHDHTVVCWRRSRSLIISLVCILSTIWSVVIVPVGQTQPAATPKTYRPPPPNPKDFDWVRLTSGEWLKGDITLMLDDKLEFDSDKLDDLKLDWEDVAELLSPRRNTCLFEGHVIVTGTPDSRRNCAGRR